jgi:proteasome lid subunit RPN8/RPN11
VLGAAHSHPSCAAVPSNTDQQLCVGPTLMLIRSGLETGLPALRAWWVQDADNSRQPPVELPITLQLPTSGAERLGE